MALDPELWELYGRQLGATVEKSMTATREWDVSLDGGGAWVGVGATSASGDVIEVVSSVGDLVYEIADCYPDFPAEGTSGATGDYPALEDGYVYGAARDFILVVRVDALDTTQAPADAAVTPATGIFVYSAGGATDSRALFGQDPVTQPGSAPAVWASETGEASVVLDGVNGGDPLMTGLATYDPSGAGWYPAIDKTRPAGYLGLHHGIAFPVVGGVGLSDATAPARHEEWTAQYSVKVFHSVDVWAAKVPEGDTAPTVTWDAAPSPTAGDTVTLAFHGADAEGGPLSYQVSFVSAPGASPDLTVDAPSGVGDGAAAFTGPLAGDYTLRCVVTDSGGLSGQADVTVTFDAPAPDAREGAIRSRPHSTSLRFGNGRGGIWFICRNCGRWTEDWRRGVTPGWCARPTCRDRYHEPLPFMAGATVMGGFGPVRPPAPTSDTGGLMGYLHKRATTLAEDADTVTLDVTDTPAAEYNAVTAFSQDQGRIFDVSANNAGKQLIATARAGFTFQAGDIVEFEWVSIKAE